MARLTKFVARVGLTLLAGCSTTLDADDYERSCTSATECVLIMVGDVCDCSCEYSSINRSDHEQYLDDRGSISCNKQCEACPPSALEAVCESGTCEAR